MPLRGGETAAIVGLLQFPDDSRCRVPLTTGTQISIPTAVILLDAFATQRHELSSVANVFLDSFLLAVAVWLAF